MFTGIVQGRASVLTIETDKDLSRLRLQFPEAALAEVRVGASIALNGVCLTVTDCSENTAAFDVMSITRELSNLGNLNAGDDVNFERAMRASDEIGGHLLSGHVAGLGRVVSVNPLGHGRLITIAVPDTLAPYLFDKGYIGVDGASLTIAAVRGAEFDLSLIPETLRLTNLGARVPGDPVNIEVDSQTRAVVDTVERMLAKRGY